MACTDSPERERGRNWPTPGQADSDEHSSFQQKHGILSCSGVSALSDRRRELRSNANCSPHVGSHRPTWGAMAQDWPVAGSAASIRPCCSLTGVPSLCQPRRPHALPKSGHVWPNSGQLWPNSGHFWWKLAGIRAAPAKLGPDLVDIGPTLVDSRPSLDGFGRPRAKSRRIWGPHLLDAGLTLVSTPGKC